ncbi:MAG: TIGR02921 family PEP-CTERM protein, partial [Cyanobacteria bacterium P01_A01_bin.68]
MKTFWNVIFQAIFWLWNLAFLGIVYFGILPYVAIPLFTATIQGEIPVEFSLTLAALVAIPTASSILGAWKFIKKSLQLIRLFYGVEAPLFIICWLRLFLIREMTPASIHIIAYAGLSIGAFFIYLLWGYNDRRKKSLQWMQMFGSSLMAFFGVYAGALLLFYALPFSVFILQEFLKFEWINSLSSSLYYGGLYALLFIILFSLSAVLFVIMPSILSGMYIYSG